MRRDKLLLLSILGLLVLSVLLSSCAPADTLDKRVHQATASYRFSLFDWEVKTLSGEIVHLFNKNSVTDNLTAQEKLMEKQVREAFSGQGIYNPLDRFINLKIGFPPVDIYLGQPPRLLVVSRRDKIETIREVVLLPDMDETEMAAIEAEIDSLGYSSLVVNLGGISTFPSYIAGDADTRFLLDTAAHEWLHLYLTFTPLGFLKLLDTLGIRHDYDVATMNETVADIVGQEIGGIIYQQYYAPVTGNATSRAAESGFDFNGEMRNIRLAVDSYLAQGQVETAEKYMEAKRQYLAANGYHIRKLNQAYFAFHGTYADSPSSVSPIGENLRELRSRSASLKDFLDKVSSITDAGELAESVR